MEPYYYTKMTKPQQAAYRAMERGYPKNDRTGGVLRGFLFQCRFADGREEVYSAAVRTDADFGTGTESSV